jgi:hypothetical protein
MPSNEQTRGPSAAASQNDARARHPRQNLVMHVSDAAELRMSRVIKMSTPKGQPASLPKTAALTKAQAEHKAWLKARGIKVSKNTLRT